MEVNFIFRRKGIAHSIEGVFENIFKFLPSSIQVKKTFVPCHRVNIQSLFRNLKFVFLNKSKLNHITGDVHYVSIVTGSKTVLTIHDIQSTLNGTTFKSFFLKVLWFKIPALLVNRITVISEFTKLELIKIVPYAKHKIVVIPNLYNQFIEFEDKDFNLIEPVILHIGTTANKNIIRVCEALDGISCKLVIVGQLDKDQLESLKLHKVKYENVFDITNEEIVALYKRCDIVSFPSLYEGFGMPIIEGNMAGRVVLTSVVCSMPEVANDAAHLIDPYDIESIRQGYLKIINDEPYRFQLIANGFRNISRFRPEIISEQYVKIYEELLPN